MNKADLVGSISEKAELTRAQATAALDAVTSSVIETLQGGEEVSLKGFGTFKSVARDARTGRNPKTGEPVQIPAKTVAKFKFSKEVSLD
mgnify:CR=1 FL=1